MMYIPTLFYNETNFGKNLDTKFCIEQNILLNIHEFKFNMNF